MAADQQRWQIRVLAFATQEEIGDWVLIDGKATRPAKIGQQLSRLPSSTVSACPINAAFRRCANRGKLVQSRKAARH